MQWQCMQAQHRPALGHLPSSSQLTGTRLISRPGLGWRTIKTCAERIESQQQQPQQSQQAPGWGQEGGDQDFARQQQQYQQYQGHYPGYGYPPYAPPPKSGGGIPAFLWIALGAGAALAINKVSSFMRNPQKGMMDMMMQQMMNAQKPGQQGGFPGAQPNSPFPGGFPPFPGSPGGFPGSDSSPASSRPKTVDTSATSSPSQPAAAPAASSSSQPDSGSTRRRRDTKPRKASSFADVVADAPPADAGFPPFPGQAPGGAQPPPQTDEGGKPKFSIDMLEMLMRDEKMQETMYQYLPENMRNKETFDWMLSNPEFRGQLQTMLEKQSENLDPAMFEQLQQVDSEAMRSQLEEIGMTPSEVMSKLMSDPELAAAMNKPNVQKAIFEARDNQMAVFKYQDDPDVMMVFQRMASLFPQQAQQAGGAAPWATAGNGGAPTQQAEVLPPT